MDAPTNRAPRPLPRRRLLQFTLRGLLLLITICSIWLGLAFHRAREQARVVAAIEAVPGYVLYDYQEGDQGFDAALTSAVPTWLLNSLGVDFFHNVIMVGFEGPPVTDDQLEPLESLPELRYLVFGPYISSKGLVHLKRLTKLQSLNMVSPEIDDDGLRELAGLHQLESLAIQEAQITDRGLYHLRPLQNLRLLKLDETKVTREGAEVLSKALPDCAISVWDRLNKVYSVTPHGPPPGW